MRGHFTLLTITLLLAGGCSSESSSGSAGSSTTTTALLAGADTSLPESLTTNAPTDSAVPADETSAPLDMGDLSVCATTKWLVLADQVDNIFEDTPLATMDGFAFEVDGQGLLDLRADGTYSYAPAFTAVITVAGQSGTGEWSGTLDGTWQIEGDQLTMTQTNDELTGTMTVFGTAQPLPSLATFEGTSTVLECTPATLTYELDTPIGPVTHTLVTAG